MPPARKTDVPANECVTRRMCLRTQ
jgi:hypothetical protein